jgi:predicted transcriptional regulator of viral defense system
MKYLDFVNAFKDFSSITTQDIKNAFEEVNYAQLTNWRKKGLLLHAKRGIFVLPNATLDSHILANELNYSYISLEYALSYYQIIPDIAQTITSISKNRNEKIQNEFGSFVYQKIAKDLFVGYALVQSEKENRNFRLASPEKALFDLVYLRQDLQNGNDFDSLRLNLPRGFRIVEIKKFASLVRANKMKKRLNNLIEYLYAVSK